MSLDSSQLPFFVDRTGSGSGAAFGAVDGKTKLATAHELVAATAAVVSNAAVDGKTAVDSKQPSKRRQKKSRKRPATSTEDDGIEGGGEESICVKIADAKRRVIDQLKLLAASDTSPESASGSGLTPKPPGHEMRFLRGINDRLMRASASAGEDAGNAGQDVFAAAAIGLGIKSTAHHAPAFIRGHQGELDEFLSSMRPDKALWRVDADDLLGASPSSASRRRSYGGGRGCRYFSDAQDPMDADCSVCLKRGHLASACKRSGPVCILCGREGHPKAECPRRLCPLCLVEDHQPDSCQRYGLFLRSSCDRCGSFGHWKDQCPDIWRQYHSTVTPGRPVVSPPAASCESESDAEAAASNPDWGRFVGQVSRLAYCCNCAHSGHSVHECIHPRSSLNRCLGSFHSQRVSRYDSEDPFAIDGADVAVVPREGGQELSGPAASSCVRRVDTTCAYQAEKESVDSAAAERHDHRPAPRVGESFIPLAANPPQPSQRHYRRGLSFREELEQQRDLARRLLPEGASRSQVKKLANRLRFWRRNGYQPPTPEQEDHMADRMEEWVLEVADTHNCMHKLNFKRRCRLLNSTGAALELIRNCRQYGEPAAPPANRKSDIAAMSAKLRNKKKKKRKQDNAAAAAAETPMPAAEPARRKPRFVAELLTAASAVPAAAAPGSWAGRLRTRSLAPAAAEQPRAQGKQLRKAAGNKRREKTRKK